MKSPCQPSTRQPINPSTINSTSTPINSVTMVRAQVRPSTHQPINSVTMVRAQIRPSTHQPINPSTHQPINHQLSLWYERKFCMHGGARRRCWARMRDADDGAYRSRAGVAEDSDRAVGPTMRASKSPLPNVAPVMRRGPQHAVRRTRLNKVAALRMP